MPFTRGGENRRKRFVWQYDLPSKKVNVQNQDGKFHSYSLQEIHQILVRIYKEFGMNYFPLANNVEKMGDGTEQMGLGMIIMTVGGKNITHAQGASYLGVILENAGYFRWNGINRGIEWRLLDTNFELSTIEERLNRSMV